jgi:hypothetical protein
LKKAGRQPRTRRMTHEVKPKEMVVKIQPVVGPHSCFTPVCDRHRPKSKSFRWVLCDTNGEAKVMMKKKVRGAYP